MARTKLTKRKRELDSDTLSEKMARLTLGQPKVYLGELIQQNIGYSGRDYDYRRYSNVGGIADVIGIRRASSMVEELRAPATAAATSIQRIARGALARRRRPLWAMGAGPEGAFNLISKLPVDILNAIEVVAYGVYDRLLNPLRRYIWRLSPSSYS